MGSIFSILSIIVFVYVTLKYRKEITGTYKKLTIMQFFGVLISYVIVIFIAFLSIYYGGNWLVSHIPVGILKTVASFVIIFAVIFSCLKVLNPVLKKISNGVL